MEEQQQFMRSYTRKEVSEKTKIGMSTLIDWETAYGDVLVIPRNEKNERFYTDFEINILNNIKTMRKQKLAHDLIKEMIKKAKEANAQHEVAASVVPIPSVPVMTAHEAIENMLKLERTVEKQNQVIEQLVKEIKTMRQESNEIKEMQQKLLSAPAPTDYSKSISSLEEKVEHLTESIESLSRVEKYAKEKENEPKKTFWEKWFRK